MILSKVDSFTISIYQSIVDFFQKKPMWWLREISYIFFAVAIMMAFFSRSGGFLTAIDLILAWFFYDYSSSEAQTASFGENDIFRLFIAALCLISIVLSFLEKDFNAIDTTLMVIRNVLFVSAYYFAACKNPAPKVPHRKLVLT